jgi:hypothetical protein
METPFTACSDLEALIEQSGVSHVLRVTNLHLLHSSGQCLALELYLPSSCLQLPGSPDRAVRHIPCAVGYKPHHWQSSQATL